MPNPHHTNRLNNALVWHLHHQQHISQQLLCGQKVVHIAQSVMLAGVAAAFGDNW